MGVKSNGGWVVVEVIPTFLGSIVWCWPWRRRGWRRTSTSFTTLDGYHLESPHFHPYDVLMDAPLLLSSSS